MAIQRFFYLRQRGQIFGPFPASQLLQMYRSGGLMPGDQVSPDKEVWRDALAFFSGEPTLKKVAPDPGEPGSAAKIPGPQSVAVTLMAANEKVEEEKTAAIKRYTATPRVLWSVVLLLFVLTLLGGGALCLYRYTFNGGSHTHTIRKKIQKESEPAADPAPAEKPVEKSSEKAPEPAADPAPAEKPVEKSSEKAPEPAADPAPAEKPVEKSSEKAPEPAADPAPAETAAAASHNAKKDWQTIIRESRDAIGVVLLEITFMNGQVQYVPTGTAWVNSPHSFVTNAHVAEGCYGAMNTQGVKDLKLYVAMNGSTKRHLIHSLQIHPGFLRKETQEDSDFAVLHTRDTLPVRLHCATDDELKKLQQGDEIMYLGFPMEGLAGGNLNLENPIATMQKGYITAISDSQYKDSGFKNNTQIRHSLPATGGASGSPIFSNNGNVIAILWGVNMDVELEIDKNTGKAVMMKREASAAMINFATRIDRLKMCLEAPVHAVTDFLRGK